MGRPRPVWWMQSSGDRLGGRDAAVIAVLVVAVLAIGWSFRAVLVTSDPWHYTRSALEFPDHEWILAGLTRWGIILPLLPVAAAFGDTLPTYYAIAFAASALIVPVVYLLSRRVMGTALAAVTVLCFVIQPLTFGNLSRGYPDLLAVALNGLALVLVLLARDDNRVWPLFVAGLVSGWAFEVRETTLFTWPIFAVLIWATARRWTGFGLFLAGLLPAAVADVLLSWRFLSDPWAKYRVLAGSDLNDSSSVLDGAYLGHDRWWYLSRLPVAMSQEPWGWVLLLVAVLGLVGGAVLWRTVGLYVVWAVLPAALLVLQAGILDPDHPSVRVDVPRYWLAFMPGLTISAVALCAHLADRLRWPPVAGGLALLTVIAVPGMRHAATNPTFYPNGGDALVRLSSQVRDGQTVWADGRTYRILPVYLKTASRDVVVRDFTRRRAQPATGDYVLLFSDTDLTCEFCKLDYDLWRAEGNDLPLSRYRLVWTDPDGKARLYQVQ